MNYFSKIIKAGLVTAAILTASAAHALDPDEVRGLSTKSPQLENWAWDTFKNKGQIDMYYMDRIDYMNDTRTYTEIMEAFRIIVTERRYLLKYIEAGDRGPDNLGDRFTDPAYGHAAWSYGPSFVVWKDPGLPIGQTDRMLVNIARAAINPNFRNSAAYGGEYIDRFRVYNYDCQLSYKAEGADLVTPISGSGGWQNVMEKRYNDDPRYSPKTDVTLENRVYASYWCPNPRDKIREALKEYINQDGGESGTLHAMQYDQIRGKGASANERDGMITEQFSGFNRNQGRYTGLDNKPDVYDHFGYTGK